MSMDLPRLGRLIRKELSEILRDRRTIITLVLMPALLYPLLSVAFQQFFLASRLTTDQGVEYHLGFVSEEDEKLFSARVAFGDHLLQSRQPAVDGETKKQRAAPAIAKTRSGDAKELEAALRAGKIDAIVRSASAKRPPAAGREVVADFEFQLLPTAPGGQGALSYIEQRLAVANEADLTELLQFLKRSKIGVASRVVRVSVVPLEEAAGGAFISLAALVPLILILMTITGAVYPAIDLTAGERERGTLEILVAAPVPRLGLLFAKYVSVVTVAIMTALVNLVAMTTTLVFSGLGPVLFGQQGLSLGTIVAVFGLLLLFAAFFSAVLLCITSFARSFKEAQAYLIPLMLVSLAPGVMGMIPGLKLSSWAAAPLVNIVLLARDLFEGNAEWGPALIVIATTLAYAAAAIALAARIFGDEGVLYSEQTSWGDLFRRPAEPQHVARLTAALWCLALMIPLNFVLRGVAMLLVQSESLEPNVQIFIGPIYTILLFGALPALFAYSGRLRMSTAFAMIPARWPAYLGGVVIGLSFWPVLFAALSWLSADLLHEHSRDLIEKVLEQYSKLAPAAKVALVVLPAVVEEWFFRGFLYGALRQRLEALPAIIVSGLLFGAAHFVLNPQLDLVRLLPSAVMGLVLGAVREMSGSVWPGMLLHATHNGLLVLLLQPDSDRITTIQPWWIAAGAAGSIVGAILFWLGHSAPAIRDQISET